MITARSRVCRSQTQVQWLSWADRALIRLSADPIFTPTILVDHGFADTAIFGWGQIITTRRPLLSWAEASLHILGSMWISGCVIMAKADVLPPEGTVGSRFHGQRIKQRHSIAVPLQGWVRRHLICCSINIPTTTANGMHLEDLANTASAWNSVNASPITSDIFGITPVLRYIVVAKAWIVDFLPLRHQFYKRWTLILLLGWVERLRIYCSVNPPTTPASSTLIRYSDDPILTPGVFSGNVQGLADTARNIFKVLDIVNMMWIPGNVIMAPADVLQTEGIIGLLLLICRIKQPRSTVVPLLMWPRRGTVSTFCWRPCPMFTRPSLMAAAAAELARVMVSAARRASAATVHMESDDVEMLVYEDVTPPNVVTDVGRFEANKGGFPAEQLTHVTPGDAPAAHAEQLNETVAAARSAGSPGTLWPERNLWNFVNTFTAAGTASNESGVNELLINGAKEDAEPLGTAATDEGGTGAEFAGGGGDVCVGQEPGEVQEIREPERSLPPVGVNGRRGHACNNNTPAGAAMTDPVPKDPVSTNDHKDASNVGTKAAPGPSSSNTSLPLSATESSTTKVSAMIHPSLIDSNISNVMGANTNVGFPQADTTAENVKVTASPSATNAYAYVPVLVPMTPRKEGQVPKPSPLKGMEADSKAGGSSIVPTTPATAARGVAIPGPTSSAPLCGHSPKQSNNRKRKRISARGRTVSKRHRVDYDMYRALDEFAAGSAASVGGPLKPTSTGSSSGSSSAQGSGSGEDHEIGEYRLPLMPYGTLMRYLRYPRQQGAPKPPHEWVPENGLDDKVEAETAQSGEEGSDSNTGVRNTGAGTNEEVHKVRCQSNNDSVEIETKQYEADKAAVAIETEDANIDIARSVNSVSAPLNMNRKTSQQAQP
ncbi:hypothetical protein HK102_011657 [Quaeritorhiza haematococci]|nr:hypothetical protein HK102_011657 [Quaeritorhiza haematococci]